MTINSINGANTQMGQMGMNQAADSYSRNIQSQIANAQKQQAKSSSMDDMLGGTRNAGNAKAGSNNTGLSQASMTAMISADNSIKQAKVQGSVATKMEGRAGILESEIKLDQARGGDTHEKEEELADVQQKAQAATSSQLSTLADANKTMEEAAKADSKEEKTNDKDTKATGTNGKDSEENVSGADTQGEMVSGAESVNTKSDLSVSSSTAAVETTAQQPTAYKSVDIRL